MANLTSQDDYIRTALRLPRDLHKEVQDSAEKNNRSMNAEIVARLQSSFEEKKHVSTTAELLVDDAIEAASDEFKQIVWKLLVQLKPTGAEAKIVYEEPLESDEADIRKVQAYLKNRKKPE